MNNNSRFSIFAAVKNGYAFVGREWPYLVRIALLPMGAQIAAAIFVQFQRPDASLIEQYLWQLPATALLGWFVFLETRLLLLGERVDRLPLDAAYLAKRRHAMRACVLSIILFIMGADGALALCVGVENAGAQPAENGLLALGSLVLLCAIIWSVRFGIIPLLAAVRYPVRPVLRQTAGPLFSLRLVGMGLLATLPVDLFSRIAMGAIIPLPEDSTAKLSDGEQIALTILGAIISLLSTALLSAAAVFALKQILGSARKGVTA